MKQPLTPPVVFMYSGQGSQYFHMGQDLFERHPLFRAIMVECDQWLISLTGNSVLDQMYDDAVHKSDPFSHILTSSAAILMVEYALSRVLMEDGIIPDYLLGASLGEVTAAVISGVVDFRFFMEILLKQIAHINTHCEPGRMIGILHEPSLFGESEILMRLSELAAVNYDRHFVISCREKDLSAIEAFLNKRELVYHTLPVAHGFHSSILDPVKRQVMAMSDQVSFARPKIPLISATHGKQIASVDKAYFWEIFREPIRFRQTLQNMEREKRYTYIDLGPSGTLANYVKYNLARSSGSKVLSILTPFGSDSKNLKKVRNFFKPRPKKVTPMKTYVFPGQGSQAVGMGERLFDDFPHMVDRADEILGYSIRKLCLENPLNKLHLTQFTQPALYVVNALSYLKQTATDPHPPDFLAGHSLGEYNALLAAEAFDFDTGLKLVQKRGEIMGRASHGAMAAILGIEEARLQNIIVSNGLAGIDIANYNTPSQFVISGPKEDIEQAKRFFEDQKVNFIPLKVSAAFHSRYMEKAMLEFKNFLSGIRFSKPTIPVISNLTARPYDGDEIGENLVKQLRYPVKWTESIQYLLGHGGMTFKEMGHGNVLTRLIRQIRNETEGGDGHRPSASVSRMNTTRTRRSHAALSPERAGHANQEKPKASTSGIPRIYAPISALSLGNPEFKKDHALKYAYVAGGMVRGIASAKMVVNMGKAGMLGFFGTGGLKADKVKNAIHDIRRESNGDLPFGMNLLSNASESELVDLFLANQILHVEAAAYIQITPAIVKYRLTGLSRGLDGAVRTRHRVMAKVSRPEIASIFLSPAPEHIVSQLLAQGAITPEQAILSTNVPMADDICVEADSGGHTDRGVAYTLMPAMIRLRDDMMKKYRYPKNIRIGAAGGIGTPEAAAAAFILGADFILTGSVNQCTVEADISDLVKDMLQAINVQDTEYAPAGDMFEFGSKVQVLKRGVFFPARANRLYELYRQYESLEDMDEKIKNDLQTRYFKQSFDDVYQEVKRYYSPLQIERAEKNPRYKMVLIFKWYFTNATRMAIKGEENRKVDFQIHCGPALGAFNQWVKGSELESWRNRSVSKIGEKLMTDTAHLLNQRFDSLYAHAS